MIEFYTRRLLQAHSAEALIEWATENNIPNILPPEELHCSIITSESDVPEYKLDPNPVVIYPWFYRVTMLQDALSVVFDSAPLLQSWFQARRIGAKLKYPRFIPHVSISYRVPEDFDPAGIKPPWFPIRLLGETQGVFNEDFKNQCLA